ncbi:MAG TPA: OmpA family protein [Burkholderiales bacterium]|jgi:OOP family OmpA-OmpF porin
MNRHKEAFPAMLALSSLLVGTLTAFSAHAAMSPGHAYDTRDVVVRDSSGQCVRTSSWSKENATKECNPELFPEPRVVAPPPAPPKPAPVAKPAPVVAPVLVATPKSKVMVFQEAALFGFDKSELTPAGQEALRKYREEARVEMNAATLVKITGHTDSIGAAEYNQQLSLRRAQAVRDYLVKLGGNPGIMEVAGMGETKPVADNKTAAGRTQNRRVEVEVVGTAK